MAKITPKQLTAVNLRYGTTAKSLKVLAFANLSAKALFLSGKLKTTQEIAKQVAKLIDVRAVSEDLIESGLDELKDDKKVVLKNNKWTLNQKAYEEMRQEASSVTDKLDSVIDRNFPKSIEKEKLKLWFNDAIVDFFDYNGDEWVRSVCKGSKDFSKRIKTIDELLNKSIKVHSLDKQAEMLKNSFRGLLASTFQEDQIFITNTGFAMFSARLVAADIGADPITLGELRNVTFLIDTNFLLALHLDGHRLASSIEALGQALKDIGAKIQYINETREEYGRICVSKKANLLKLLEIYPARVVMDVDDELMSTALARGCKKTEDFERFFSSISELPREIPNGPSLNLLDDKNVAEEINKAKKDSTLKKEIQKWCSKSRPIWQKLKTDSALEHDAALIYVTEFEKKSGNKTFILTLDKSLQACSAERVGSHEIPLAIHLEGLIQILAANNAGPNFDATNFAPLMNSILLKRCMPSERTYNIQDLHWLYKIQKNVAEFSPEKIRRIILEVTKARLAGKTANNKQLERTVNRFYQEEMQNIDQKMEKALKRTRDAEEFAGEEKDKRLKLEHKLRKKEARDKLITSLIWRIPAIIIFSLIVFYIIRLILPVLPIYNLLDFFITIGILFVTGYKFLKKPIQKYCTTKKELG